MSLFARTFFIVLILLLLLGGSWVAGLFYFHSNLVRTPPLIDRQTDAIVVLTGGSERVEEGVALLQANMANRLFISGAGKGVTAKDILSLAHQTHDDNLLRRIEIGHVATDTIGNAHEVTQWIHRKRYRSLRLVTSHYHMPRSLLELRRVLSDNVTIVPHPVISDNIKAKQWLEYDSSRALIIREYNKLIGAWLHKLYTNLQGKL